MHDGLIARQLAKAVRLVADLGGGVRGVLPPSPARYTQTHGQ